jgi:chromate transporter
MQSVDSATGDTGTVLEVGAAFLKLGVSSFGGPIAHLGYFRREFVERRRWLDEERFADLLGLCQFLPGPASSQLGFCIGLLRAGWGGALAAFLCFTLPSALLLFALAAAGSYFQGAWGRAAVHGLQLVAVAVVAHAVLGMARTLTPDRPRALLAAGAAGAVALAGTHWISLLVILGGAALGPWVCRDAHLRRGVQLNLGYGRRGGGVLLLAFAVVLLFALLVTRSSPPIAQVVAAFYRAGALVFGGGHVVLPLLKEAVVAPGWLDNDTFLTGYGAAQAVPGPLFSVAAFLGARLPGPTGGVLGATSSLLAIFMPGLLLVSGALPFWKSLSARNGAARALAGVNAAVVGLLAAACYDPVWVSAVQDAKDFAIALIGFALLAGAGWSAWTVVVWCVLATFVTTWIAS